MHAQHMLLHKGLYVQETSIFDTRECIQLMNHAETLIHPHLSVHCTHTHTV